MVVLERRQRNRSYKQIGQIVAIDHREQPCYPGYRFQIAENLTTGSAEATGTNDGLFRSVEPDGPDGTGSAVELKTFGARESLSLKWPSTLEGLRLRLRYGAGPQRFRPFILGQRNAASGELAAGGKLADEAGLPSIIPRGKRGFKDDRGRTYTA